MLKIFSIMTIVGFFGFWAFGALALSDTAQSNLTVLYVLFAFSGLVLGSFSYLRLCRNTPSK